MAKRSQTRETLKRLNILARTSSPRWVRTAYRLARSVKLAPFSQPLPADLVKDCRVCADRVNMFHELPRNGVVAELGTYIGDFARLIVERTEPRELHLIDIDYSRFVDTGLTDARVKRHRGLTHEVIASFPDAYFDWIYVDADHSYNATLRDARASAPKLRPGGLSRLQRLRAHRSGRRTLWRAPRRGGFRPRDALAARPFRLSPVRALRRGSAKACRH